MPNTTDISITSTGSDIRIAGVGISAGNLGKIDVATVTSGSIVASAPITVSGGQIALNSVARIDADTNAALNAPSLELNARSGISIANAQTPIYRATNLTGNMDVTNSHASNSFVDLVNSSNGGLKYSQTQGDATI